VVFAFLFVVLMSCGILAILLFIFVGNKVFSKKQGKSPYGGGPLRKLEELHYDKLFLLERYLQSHNLSYSLKESLICEKTGRVFPKKTLRFNTLSVSRNFLSRMHQGKWLLWSSLSDQQKKKVVRSHLLHYDQLEQFQCEGFQNKSSLEEERRGKPGPLYVDLKTKNLLGWRSVPTTDLELLVWLNSSSK